MGERTNTQTVGGRRAALGLGLGKIARAALTWLPRRAGSGVVAESQAGAVLGPRAASEQTPQPAGAPAVGAATIDSETGAYEYLSRVVWSDNTRGITSDLEDAEGLEAVASDGWELVHVIVPFAQTRHLDISYPGNTRKLIAYYRRPRGLEET